MTDDNKISNEDDGIAIDDFDNSAVNAESTTDPDSEDTSEAPADDAEDSEAESGADQQFGAEETTEVVRLDDLAEINVPEENTEGDAEPDSDETDEVPVENSDDSPDTDTDGDADTEAPSDAEQATESEVADAADSAAESEESESETEETASDTPEDSSSASRKEEAEKAWASLLERFEKELGLTESADRLASLHFTVGEIYNSQASDPEKAWEHFEKAVQAVPNHQPALRGLLRLYKEMARWDKVIGTLDALEEATLTDAERIELFIEKAQVLSTRMQESGLAIGELEKVLEIDPKNNTAFKLLEKIYTVSDDRGALIAFYQRYLEDTRFTDQHLQLLINLARVQESLTHVEQEAIETYQSIIELDPTNLLAINALKRLLIKHRRWDLLSSVYHHEATVTEEPKRKALVIYLQARLQTDHLNNPDRAVELLQEGLEIDPSNSQILEELESISEINHRWDDLIDIRQRQMELTEDPTKQVEIAFKIGTIMQDKLHNQPAASGWYERALQLRPDYLPALHVLGKLYASNNDYEKLISILKRETEHIQDDRRKAARWFTVAETARTQLHDHEQAIAAYHEVLKQLPGYLPAIKALSELYAYLGRNMDLVEMNELQIANNRELNAEQYIYLLEKNASIWEHNSDLEKAADCHRRILERNHRHMPSIQALGRIYATGRKWEDLIDINQRESDLINDQHRIVSLLCRNGEIYERELRDEPRAIDYYRQVLTLSPGYMPAVKALGAIYQRKGDWDELIKMYHQELESTGDGEHAIAIRFNIAQIYDEELDNSQKAETNYNQILEDDPGFTPALHALTKLYQRTENYQALADLYERLLDRCSDKDERRLYQYKISELYESHLSRLDKAEWMYRQILGENDTDLVARRGLTRIYAQTEKVQDQIAIIRPELAAAEDSAVKLPLLMSLADLVGESGDNLDESIAIFREVLEIDPFNTVAFQQLERLYRKAGRYANLSRAYRRQLDRIQLDSERTPILHSLIDILENHLADFDLLESAYTELLRIQPYDVRALAFFEDVYTREKQWEKLLDVYDRLRQISEDRTQLIHIYQSMGQLTELELGKPDLALARYESVLSLEPTYYPAIQGAKRVYVKLEKWADLISLLETELQRAPSSQSFMSTAYQLAYIKESKFNQRQAACDLYCKVLELDSMHKEAFMRARKLLLEDRQFGRLMEIYERRLSANLSEEDREDMHRHIADLAEQELGDLDRAIEHRKWLVEARTNDLAEMKALGNLYTKASRWRDAIMLFEQLAPKMNDSDELRDLYFQMGTIYSEELRDSARAASAFETVLTYEPNDLQTMEKLGRLYKALKLSEEASEILRRLLSYELPKEKEIRYNLDLGEIYLDQLRQEDEAIPFFEKALILDPNNKTVIETLTRLFEKHGQWERCVQLYETSINKLDPGQSDQRIGLLIGLSRVYLEGGQDVEAALKRLEDAERIEPMNSEIQVMQARALGMNALYYVDAIDKHRQLLRQNPFRADSYRELGRIFEERTESDKAYCASMVLDFLRELEGDDAKRYHDQKARITGGIAAVIPDGDYERLLLHPEEKTLVHDILRILKGLLSKLEIVESKDYDLANCKVAGVNSSIYHMLESAAYYLGVDLFRVYISQEKPDLLGIENTKPPTIVMGGNLAFASEGIKRFLSGMAMSRIRNGHALFVDQSPEKLQFWVEAAVNMYVPEMNVHYGTAEEVKDFTTKVNKIIPKNVRKDLDALAREYHALSTKPDFIDVQSHLHHTDNRMGLLLAGDLISCAECLTYLETGRPYRAGANRQEVVDQYRANDQIKQLLQFAVSEEFFELRQLIKMDVG